MSPAQFATESAPTGEWKRQGNHFTGRISRDSGSGPGEGPDEKGRRFTLDPGGQDPVLGISYLSEAY
jgi:putative glutathione S-transferase